MQGFGLHAKPTRTGGPARDLEGGVANIATAQSRLILEAGSLPSYWRSDHRHWHVLLMLFDERHCGGWAPPQPQAGGRGFVVAIDWTVLCLEYLKPSEWSRTRIAAIATN